MILLNQVIELWVVALPGLWVTGYHRIMGFPPYTNSGTPKTYGLSQVMAYEGYGLRGCRLYLTFGEMQSLRYVYRLILIVATVL